MILDKMNSGCTDDQPRLNLESAGARNIGLATEPKADTSTAEPALRRRRPPVLLAELPGCCWEDSSSFSMELRPGPG